MNRIALGITFDQIARKQRARQERAANPKVRVDLRLAPHVVEAIDEAATAAGLTIDQYIERVAMEAGT